MNLANLKLISIVIVTANTFQTANASAITAPCEAHVLPEVGATEQASVRLHPNLQVQNTRSIADIVDPNGNLTDGFRGADLSTLRSYFNSAMRRQPFSSWGEAGLRFRNALQPLISRSPLELAGVMMPEQSSPAGSAASSPRIGPDFLMRIKLLMPHLSSVERDLLVSVRKGLSEDSSSWMDDPELVAGVLFVVTDKNQAIVREVLQKIKHGQGIGAIASVSDVMSFAKPGTLKSSFRSLSLSDITEVLNALASKLDKPQFLDALDRDLDTMFTVRLLTPHLSRHLFVYNYTHLSRDEVDDYLGYGQSTAISIDSNIPNHLAHIISKSAVTLDLPPDLARVLAELSKNWQTPVYVYTSGYSNSSPDPMQIKFDFVRLAMWAWITSPEMLQMAEKLEGAYRRAMAAHSAARPPAPPTQIMPSAYSQDSKDLDELEFGITANAAPRASELQRALTEAASLKPGQSTIVVGGRPFDVRVGEMPTERAAMGVHPFETVKAVQVTDPLRGGRVLTTVPLKQITAPPPYSARRDIPRW